MVSVQMFWDLKYQYVSRQDHGSVRALTCDLRAKDIVSPQPFSMFWASYLIPLQLRYHWVKEISTVWTGLSHRITQDAWIYDYTRCRNALATKTLVLGHPAWLRKRTIKRREICSFLVKIYDNLHYLWKGEISHILKENASNKISELQLRWVTVLIGFSGISHIIMQHSWILIQLNSEIGCNWQSWGSYSFQIFPHHIRLGFLSAPACAVPLLLVLWPLSDKLATTHYHTVPYKWPPFNILNFNMINLM